MILTMKVLLVGTLCWWTQHHVQSQWTKYLQQRQAIGQLQLQYQKEWTTVTVLHQRALDLYNSSCAYSRQARYHQDQILQLQTEVAQRQQEASYFYYQANQIHQAANKDAKDAFEWYQQEQLDQAMETAKELQAEFLNATAYEELQESKIRLQHAQQQDFEAQELIQLAEQALEQAQEAWKELHVWNETMTSSTEGGICRWIEWACRLVRRNRPDLDRLDLTLASHLAVQAAVDYNQALELQQAAQQERQVGIGLYYQYLVDGNTSEQLLHDSMVLKRRIQNDTTYMQQSLERARTELAQAAEDEKRARQADESAAHLQQLASRLSLNAQDALALSESQATNLAETNSKIRIEETTMIPQLQDKIRQNMDLANASIQGSGWYTMASILAGAVLLLLTCYEILYASRRVNMVRWLARGRPWIYRDASYILNHVLIFFLAFSFQGELLREFSSHGLVGWMEVISLFSLCGALIQAFLLHFLPHIIRLFLESSFLEVHVQQFLWQDLIQRCSLLTILFALEILLLQVNLGRNRLVAAAYELNNGWSLWILVALTVMTHISIFDYLGIFTHGGSSATEQTARLSNDAFTNDSVSCSLVYSSSPSSTVQSLPPPPPATFDDDETMASEQSSLVTTTTLSSRSATGELFTIDLSWSGRRYGSASRSISNHRTAIEDPLVSSSGAVSMREELLKLFLLLNLVLSSWSWWMIWKNLEWIIELHRMTSRQLVLVWSTDRMGLMLLTVFILFLGIGILMKLPLIASTKKHESFSSSKGSPLDMNRL